MLLNLWDSECHGFTKLFAKFILADDLVDIMTEVNLESLSISELREMLSENASLLKKLGIKEDEVREVFLEKRILHLAKKLFDDISFLMPSKREVSVFEFDVAGNPTTQNAALAEREGATAMVVKETLKRVIIAIDKNVNLLEED